MNILGAGITGLMLGYLTKSPVYGETIGGQMTGLPKGPRILHHTPETEAFMKELGLDFKPRVFQVGYNASPGGNPGVVSDTVFASARLEYYKKTRGSDNPPPGSVMSGGAQRIYGWDISTIPLVDILASQVRVIPSRVDSLDFDNNSVVIQSNGQEIVLPLEESLNTIALPRTLKLIEQDLHEVLYLHEDKEGEILKAHDSIDSLDLSAYDTTFLKVDVSKMALPFVPEPYSYIYFTSQKNPINRVTRIDSQYCIFETRGDRYEQTVDYLEAMGLDPGYCETIRFCQLKQSHRVKELAYERNPNGARLRLCGRFACWDHGFKIDSIFEEARKYAEQMGG